MRWNTVELFDYLRFETYFHVNESRAAICASANARIVGLKFEQRTDSTGIQRRQTTSFSRVDSPKDIKGLNWPELVETCLEVNPPCAINKQQFLAHAITASQRFADTKLANGGFPQYDIILQDSWKRS